MLKLTKNEYKDIVNNTILGFQRSMWDYGSDDKDSGEFVKHMNSGDKKLVHGLFNIWIAAIQRIQEMLDYVDFSK